MKTKRIGKHRECVESGKICFSSEEQAIRRINAIFRADDAPGYGMHSYLCPFCGRYHLASDKKKSPGISPETSRRKRKLQGILKPK